MRKNLLMIALLIVFVIIFSLYCCKRYDIYNLFSFRNMESFENGSKMEKISKVLENGDSVFLKLHADWCGYCKKLLPEWEKLEKISRINGKNVHIVEIEENDSDMKNYVEKYGNIDGFPTIVFMTKSKKMDYPGSRTFDDMKEFLKKNVE